MDFQDDRDQAVSKKGPEVIATRGNLSDTIRKMVRIIQDNEEFMNANHNKYGLERVLSENYAFIAESSSLDLMDPDKRCQVYQVGQPLISVFHGVGMQKSMII